MQDNSLRGNGTMETPFTDAKFLIIGKKKFDNEMLHEWMASVLEEYQPKIAVEWATSYDESVKLIKTNPIICILITSVLMFDSHQMLTFLKTIYEKFPSPNCIIWTAYKFTDSESEFLESFNIKYLFKLVRFNEIKSAVFKALENYKMQNMDQNLQIYLGKNEFENIEEFKKIVDRIKSYSASRAHSGSNSYWDFT